MKTYITHNAMINELVNDSYANWTYEGADALITYLEELESELGTDLDFDRVALRCEWCIYPDVETAKHDYSIEDDYDLEDYTHVIYYDGGIIIQDF